MDTIEQSIHPRAVRSVYVVDDDTSFRTSLTRVLNASGLHAIGFACAEDYLRSDDNLPGCIVLDVSMPGQSGLDMFDELATRDYAPPVIFLTGSGDVPASVYAMKSGAADFLTKPVTKEKLLQSVEKALAIDAAQRAASAQLDTIRHRYEMLNARERQVLLGIVDGQLNKQLASTIGVSERTVKALRAQVMTKMSTDTLPALIKAATVLGVI